MAGVNDLNRLKNTTCYLCGPMDRVDDGGVGWREDITPILKEMGNWLSGIIWWSESHLNIFC